VRSVIRTLRPDAVWFYYDHEPVVDAKLYHTWWSELADDVPFLHRRSLRDARVGGRRLPTDPCDASGRPSVEFVYALVNSRGGTYVDEATIVVERPPDDQVTVAVDVSDAPDDFRLRLLKADRGASCSSNRSRVRLVDCPSDAELSDAANATVCFHLAQSLYPRDIWTLDSEVGRQLRRAFYGRSDLALPSPSYEQLAPNIGHVSDYRSEWPIGMSTRLESLESRSFLSIPGKEFLDFRQSRLATDRQ